MLSVLATFAVAACVSVMRADTHDAEFRPGPNVPKDFLPVRGVDASGMDLSGSHFIGVDLAGSRFSRCDLRKALFLQVNFAIPPRKTKGPADSTRETSFRSADLRDAIFAEADVYRICDFNDALINGAIATDGHTRFLSIDQLRSTKSYRIKDLSRCYIMGELRPYGDTDYPKITLDLSGFDLEGATLTYADFTGCTFFDAKMNRLKFRNALIEQRQLGDWSRKGHDATVLPRKDYQDFEFFAMDLRGWNFRDADIRGSTFLHVKLEGVDFSGADIRQCHFSKSIGNEQLRSTKSYRNGDLCGAKLDCMDLSRVNLARMNLADVQFIWCNLAEADFTDAVISAGVFRGNKNLTLDQIKSTWNYKHGRMEGIRLPEELAKALEQEAQENEEELVAGESGGEKTERNE